MGNRYELSIECPNCHRMVRCYYAESSGMNKARCDYCGKEFEIVMVFKLVEEK